MNLTEQIYAQALLLAGQLDRRQEVLLRMLCQAAEKLLAARLRTGITAEDCKSDFVSAASLLALAVLSETDEMREASSFTVGDLTVKKGESNAAAACLRRQAELMILPYQRDEFAFRGV